MRNKFLVFMITLFCFLIFGGICFSDEKIPGKDEALEILKDLAPDLKILEVKESPIKGLWEIDVQSGDRKGLIYLDYSKKYFMQGAIFDLKTKTNLTQERISELNKVDTSTIPLDDALLLGEKDAKYKVIVFSDPDCPYCSRLHEEMKKVVEKRKDISFYIKMYPLPMHKGAYEKSKAIVCEKSLKMLEDAFAKKNIPEAKCDGKAVDETLKLAEKLGIKGTPAIVLPNGVINPGYKEADALIATIEKAK